MERDLRTLAVGSKGTPGGPVDVKMAYSPPGIAGSAQAQALTGKTMTLGSEATQGILGKGGDFNILKGSMLADPSGKIKLGTAAALGTGLISLISSAKTPQEAGTALASQTGNSDDYERGAQLFAQLKPELFEVPEQFRMPVKDGGRIGFREGTGRRGLTPDLMTGPKESMLNPTAGLGSLEGKEFKFDAQEFMINKYKEDGTKPNIIGEGIMGDEKMFVIETPGFGTMTITLDQYLENFGIPEREIGGLVIMTDDGPKLAKKDGGLMRTNFAMGSDDDPKPLPEDPTKPINPFGPKPIKPLVI